MRTSEPHCSFELRELRKIAYFLPLALMCLLVFSGQQAWAQIDPNGPPPGGCDPNAIDPTPCPSDGDPCTTEVCNPSTHQCESVPVGPGGPDQCQPGGCDPNAIDPGQCPSDGNPCTNEVCNPSTHRCESVPVGPGGPDQCQPGGCDPTAEEPCPPGDSLCSPNVCNPESHECEPKPVVCSHDECSPEVCDPETGDCKPDTTNPPPEGCEGAICRTPGFWATHAAAATKTKAVNITQAVINKAGGTLSVCGKAITSTILYDNNSALEGLCVSPSGDIRLQLVRQLISAALNCVISGGGGDCFGTPLFHTVFSNCDAVCSDSGASKDSITSCINQLDCLNNGGTQLANGFCQTGSCHDGTACKEGVACLDGSKCIGPDGNCHDQLLVNPALGLDFDPPGPAGSSTLCNSANKSLCTVIGKGLVSCTK